MKFASCKFVALKYTTNDCAEVNHFSHINVTLLGSYFLACR